MTVVLAAHGSPDPRHASVMEAIRAAAGVRLGDARLGWLGHQSPGLGAVVTAALTDDPETVVVPLLLAPAFHARVDVPAGAGAARVAAVLAPDARLVEVLDARVREALAVRGDGRVAPDALVLAAAGSTDPAGDTLVRAVAADWSARTGLPAEVCYASAAPSMAEAVSALRALGASQVVVGSFLLAPGRLHDSVVAAGVGAGVLAVAAPLGAHPLLVDVIVDRATAARSEAALRG